MTAVREKPPQGRYGRSADAAADRRLRGLAWVCGALMLIALVAGGWMYTRGDSVNADVVSFKVVSASEVRAQLQVYKQTDQTVQCTVRSLAVDQSEVGRKAVTVGAHGSTVDTVVTIRTTGRATDAELVGCSPVSTS
ncbi:DUF4307 domain-containing protein [Streptomyces sp. SL13]|jgi:hypothetical protein|uniref:DUF4307 domain-containing protein n=1 Tax=Streptantibioticus silvisoli TaxID=2705255 RepID=A0AA90GYG4_9ACTN|nr:DUF4307 domain-containing protein [Streptantibioticus silvisoli]MDI5966887.1 DUF4307 domain-containing protein [Streptantibioticus silvisoli]MDI5970104.1 DUF4307 domain-containing protein [Streptantibioticus silvisoli]